MAEVNLDSIVTNNSDAARRQERTAPPVEEKAPPTVRERRPGFVGRILGGRVRIAENFEGAGQTVLEEVIIPALIDGIRDAIYTATDYILYGGSQRRNRNNKRSGGSYTSYSKKSQQRSGARKTAPSSSAYYFTYDERSDADKDLEKMRDVIDQVDFVTIMDMFSIAKRQTNNYTYNDWGWYDLRSAMVRRTTDGRFYIDLPKPVPIEE